MLANYHTHTYRCKHATGEDREYIEEAIQGGMKVLGFSDHCPWIYEDDHVSGIRMTPYQMDDYINSLVDLREEYKQDITIYIGFESEYIEELIEKQNKLFQEYPLDYMILGQHFNGPEKKNPYTGFETKDVVLLERYVELVIKALSTKQYQYVAHPDLIHYTGDSKIYEYHMTKLCNYLKEQNIPVEINMLGLMDGRHYPNERFMKIAKEVGNKGIIGVDAHEPRRLSDVAGHNRCMEYAKRFGLELVDYLPGLGPK